MIDLINRNATLTQKFTSRLFDHENHVIELMLSMLFAIIVSETLAFLLYQMISTHSQAHFYSTFPSYTSFMYDLIDGNESPSIPVNGVMNRSISRLSLYKRKLLIGKKLTTRRLDASQGKKGVNQASFFLNHGDTGSCFLNLLRQHITSSKSNMTSTETHKTYNVDEDYTYGFQCAICLVEFSKFFNFF